MKRKAILMTWFREPNYGTLLQCDATVRLLKARYNIDVDIPNYIPIGKRDVISIIKKVFSIRTWKRQLRIAKGKKEQQKAKTGFEEKHAMVEQFIKHYSYALNGKLIRYDSDFKALVEQYSVFISGSDQIWNSDFLNERYLLDFVPESKQCISVASSVSKKSIEPEYEPIYKKHLKKYKGISVREGDYIEQLEALSGLKVFQVLDPTIMLGADQWKSLMCERHKSEYLLTYILGVSELVREQAIKVSEKYNKPLYFFPHMDGMYTKADEMMERKGIPLWGEDPYAWIGWIYDADLIITDSFHMTVFSIMLHKNFYVVPKEINATSQNNRILNILNVVDLADRFIPIQKLSAAVSDTCTIDWERVDAKLAHERERSLNNLDCVVDTIDWSAVDG